MNISTPQDRSIDFIPIVRPVTPKFSDIAGEVEDIISSGVMTKGPRLKAMEESMAQFLRVKHAIGVSSCTSGLMLTLIGLGIKGSVALPSFTFLATGAALARCGLNLKFVEIDPRSKNICPESLKQTMSPDVKAIVAVHNYGTPADVDSLEQIAREHGVPLIFDAAHAFGASKGVSPIGGQGRASVFSMSPTKLVVAGEGGLVATNDDDLAQRIRMGRDYGMSKGYDSLFPGLNARLPEFNALMALKSLAMLEDAVNRRNEVADLYKSRLLALDGISFQEVLSGDRSSYKDFTIFIDENRFNISRDGLAQALRERNIDSRAYYDPPVHQQQAYRQYHNGEDLRWTDAAAKEAISLPIWSDMDPGIVERICDQIISIHKSKE